MQGALVLHHQGCCELWLSFAGALSRTSLVHFLLRVYMYIKVWVPRQPGLR